MMWDDMGYMFNMGHILYGGVHSHGGTPIAGWFTRETPYLEWMMTGGTPISGKLQMRMFS